MQQFGKTDISPKEILPCRNGIYIKSLMGHKPLWSGTTVLAYFIYSLKTLGLLAPWIRASLGAREKTKFCFWNVRRFFSRELRFFVPRRKSKGTIVMGPSFRPSVDTLLSPQLLLQFSRDFDETFQLLFP